MNSAWVNQKAIKLMKHKIIWRQIQICSSETLLELSGDERKLLSTVVSTNFSNYWQKKIISQNRRTETLEARKERWWNHKKVLKFSSLKLQNQEKFGRKSIFMSSYIFYETAVLLLFVVDVNGKERKTHLNPLFFTTLRVRSEIVSPFEFIGDDAMREHRRKSEDPTKVSPAIETENVKSF